MLRRKLTTERDRLEGWAAKQGYVAKALKHRSLERNSVLLRIVRLAVRKITTVPHGSKPLLNHTYLLTRPSYTGISSRQRTRL